MAVLHQGCETVTVTAWPLHPQVIFEAVVASHSRLPSVLVSSCHDAGILLAEESSAIRIVLVAVASEQATVQAKLSLDKLPVPFSS